ncbi:MAG: NAD(P)/FAD-dependent oxidoreductase [Chloroflexi bacterium]|nr:NAD(P)/FAD-dependent oxidoreductase [Chloroflexota bacterium]MQC27680.1 NAD(P)/FAD-dependent oxidoreductase [Chloroflexota bacterium]
MPRASRPATDPARAERRAPDVVVIGGGPGGSTTATLLAAGGHDVLLLEREHFPRPHVGESLLPASMPVLEALGVRDQLEAAGFLKKWGATMVWGTDPEPWSWYFRETNRRYPHSFQVERAEFDKILLDHARTAGVDVREGHRVIEVLFEGDAAVGVRFADERGREHTVRCRFVVDASGQGAVIGHALKLRQWDPFFRNLAIYGYYEGARHLDGDAETNILVEAHADGWCWVIPLHTGRSSVGVVLDSARAQPVIEREGLRAAFESALAGAPRTAALIADATLTEGPIVVKDWSYVSDEVVGDGYILVGDAACFVDPLFSSGVHLALSSGMLAAAYVTTALKDHELAHAAGPVYKTLYYTQYRHFHEMAKLFYSSNRNADSYFWEARRIVGEDEGFSPRHAFINAVAGQPPQGYERVVLERGDAPGAFVESVQAVEEERAARERAVAEAHEELLAAVPVLMADARVEVQPVLGDGEFEWGHVLLTPMRPEGTACSALVAELLARFDGEASVSDVLRSVCADFSLDPEAIAETVTAAVRILYVDGTIEQLAGFAPGPR